MSKRAATTAVWVALVFVVLGYFFKGQCLQPVEGLAAYQRLCYSDLPPLYGLRGIVDHVFPYVNARLDAGNLVDGAIEYPVLTGLYMWFSGLLVENHEQYFVVSALTMGPLALVTAYLLGRLSGWRALMWAAAPPLVLYAFHNWDLLVVTATVIGLWFWSRGKPLAAAVWLGIGAAFKLYPIFFLAPLFLYVLRRDGARRASAALGAGAGTFALVNLPFVILNPSGWWATYEFHRLRGPNYDNMWALWFPSDTWLGSFPALTPATLNVVTGVLTATFFVTALAVGWMRSERDGAYPFLQVCGALLVAFMLWNKVHSPQYTLWILPFFVLLRVNFLWWVGYVAIDLAVYYGVFQWFYDLSQGRDFETAKKVMIGGVWYRAVLLLVLFFVFLLSRGTPPGAELEDAGVREPRLPEPDANDTLATAPV
ncbi:MAG TPA: glycosyltransferase 87 family protein [Actinomycetota bacterium]|nr:glycosyltransferase 87 family protein [Actinomycetota bacterium]